MRLALAQLNPLVGDLAGNGEKILAACREAADLGADLVLTPELSLWGYPPRDLLLSHNHLVQQPDVLNHMASILAREAPDLAVLGSCLIPIRAWLKSFSISSSISIFSTLENEL